MVLVRPDLHKIFKSGEKNDPTERIIRTLEGKPVDRVPTFCAGLEDRTFNEVLGNRG